MLYGDSQDNTTTDRIIACAVEVHRHLGPGLLESIYESALCLELTAAELPYRRQVAVPLYYKGRLLSEHRPDTHHESPDWTDLEFQQCLAETRHPPRHATTFTVITPYLRASVG